MLAQQCFGYNWSLQIADHWYEANKLWGLVLNPGESQKGFYISLRGVDPQPLVHFDLRGSIQSTGTSPELSLGLTFVQQIYMSHLAESSSKRHNHRLQKEVRFGISQRFLLVGG